MAATDKVYKDASLFPSDLIDPKLKNTKEWCMQFARAVNQEWKNGLGLTSYNRRQDFIKNRKYADGNQDNDRYKQQYTSANQNDAKTGYANLNFSIVSTMPRTRKAVLGYLGKIQYDFNVEAIDEKSHDQKQMYKYMIWAYKQLQENLKRVENTIGQKVTSFEPPFLPDSMEELEMWVAQQGLRLPTEMSFEDAIGLVNYLSDWELIERDLDADLFDNGIAATKVYRDTSGKIRVRYCDPVNLVVSYTRHGNCEQLRYVGEIRRMTIGELMADAGSEFDINEYEKIARAVAPANGRGDGVASFQLKAINSDTVYGYEWENWGVDVLDIEYRTADTMKHAKKYKSDDKKGDFSMYKKGYNFKPESDRTEVVETSMETWYKAKWIVDTDYCYQWGPLEDVVRDEKDLGKAKSNYTVYRSDLKSINEQMQPIVDDIMQTWLRIQNAKAKARPKGLMIEMGSLENINLGGEELTPLQVLSIYNTDGNLLYKGTGHYKDLDMGGTPHRPIEELQGGMGGEFVELVNSLNTSIGLLREVSGVNEAIDASKPESDTLVGTLEIAAQGAFNVLRGLLLGRKHIYLETCKKIAGKLQIMAKFGGLDVYKRAIGAQRSQMIKMNSDVGLCTYGYRVIERPTEEEKAYLQQAVMEALKTEKIEFPDYLFLMQIIVRQGNLKYAEAILSHRISKRKQAAEQMQQQAIAQQGQQNMQAQQAKVQSDAQLKQVDGRIQVGVEKLKSMLRIQEQNNKDRNASILKAREHGWDMQKINEEWDRKDENLLLEMEKEKEILKASPKQLVGVSEK